MKKLRIFVSSVQKELEIERVALAGWVSADSQLSEVCDVVLFEKEPLSGKRISKPYLECLKSCQIYLLIIDCEYGNPPEFSPTHEEYRFARDRNMPILVCIKGMSDGKREGKTETFIAEVKKDKNTYRRFHDRVDLQPEVRDALRRVLKEGFDIDTTSETSWRGTVTEPASMFEQQALEISAEELDADKVTTSWVVSNMEISKGTAFRDLNGLCELGILEVQGKGRGAHYIPKQVG